MRARLLLPLLWLLGFLPAPRLLAQGRPPGPWRLTYQMEQRWVHGPDTITKELVQKWVPNWTYHEVTWDIEPDSIRLFLNCENPLIAPPQPRNGQPAIRFSTTGATVRLDVKSHRLFIVPQAATVTLWAYRGTALVFKHVFKAIPPPLPIVEAWLTDEKLVIYERPPASKGARFRLAVKAPPDMDFAQIMPDDAKYRVSQYQLTILRNNKLVEPTKTMSGLESNSEVPLNSAQSGDKVQIDVQQVQRQNFRGIVEAIPYIKHFTFTLR